MKKDTLGIFENNDPIDTDVFARFCGDNRLSINQIYETRIIINEYLKLADKMNYKTRDFLIRDLCLSTRGDIVLHNMLGKDATIYDLAIYIYNKGWINLDYSLLKQPNFGNRSLNELKQQLLKNNLTEEFNRIIKKGI